MSLVTKSVWAPAEVENSSLYKKYNASSIGVSISTEHFSYKGE